MKITTQQLLHKLKQLDEKLVNIWLVDDSDLTDDELWEIFLVLLESRVELLKCCREAGIKLTDEQAVPSWLDRLVNRKKEIRLRELKNIAGEFQRRKQVSAYDVSSDPKDGEADL